ncbi:OsmC family protein [Moheibacter sp.]|uniref:OsmC family protein n=1 Tax=Moheibacter sp. TaxID=1965316 RepID=UPI003C78161B
MTSKIIYKGGLRTEAVHLQSGTQIETDAPTDNNGKGERFSPTDLVATALGSCMLTIMGIAGNTHGYKIAGTEVEITKIMTSNPRRIGEIVVKMTIKGQDTYSDKEKAIIENTAMTCPVFLSLHEDVKKTVEFLWPKN